MSSGNRSAHLVVRYLVSWGLRHRCAAGSTVFTVCEGTSLQALQPLSLQLPSFWSSAPRHRAPHHPQVPASAFFLLWCLVPCSVPSGKSLWAGSQSHQAHRICSVHSQVAVFAACFSVSESGCFLGFLVVYGGRASSVPVCPSEPEPKSITHISHSAER